MLGIAALLWGLICGAIVGGSWLWGMTHGFDNAGGGILVGVIGVIIGCVAIIGYSTENVV